MKVGILGTGDVGRALGRGFLACGHPVMMGSREAGNPKVTNWAQEAGANASAGSFADAARFGDIVVIATLGLEVENAIRLAGSENFLGKVVLDTTNPLDFSKGMPPKLVGGLGTSSGEKVQNALPGARVVKVFNTVGNPFMYKPSFPEGTPSMFLCGNDVTAKEKVTKICHDFGWETVDIGGISGSHYLESMCLVWVLAGIQSKNWQHAFKLLRMP